MYDLDAYFLHGRVKVIIEKNYEINPAIESGNTPAHNNRMQLKKSKYYSFNDGGQLMQQTSFDKDGNISRRRVFSLRPDGRLDNDILYVEKNLVFFTDHLYDSNGKHIGYNEFIGERNDADNSIEKVLTTTYLFLFNSRGRITGWEGYTTRGELKEIAEYTLNGNDDVVAIKHIRDGAIVHRDHSEYNDENVEVVRTIIADNNAPKAIYRFDDLHNLLEINYFNTDGIIEKHRQFSYDFDKYNNWIKRTEFENAILKRESYREIEYYEAV